MKRGFMLLLLFVAVFGVGAFANGETEDSEKPSSDIKTQKSSRYQEYRAARLDGREAVVRIYDNWREDRAEFKQVTARFAGDEIILDSYDIDEPAFIVLVKEDQSDKVVRMALYSRIYAESYKKGVPLKLSIYGSISREFTFKDAEGNPLSSVHAKMFIYGKDDGIDSRILVKEIEPDESGIFESPSIFGSLNLSYFVFTQPDNFGVVVVDSAKLEYLTSLTIKLPWISQETMLYEDSRWCVVVDDANNPISSASVRSDLIDPLDGHSISKVKPGGLKFLTDEEGRFSLYIPMDGYYGDDIWTAQEHTIRIDAPENFGLVPFAGFIPKKVEYVIEMADTGQFHTFAFEDEYAKIVDPKRLKYISLDVKQEGKPKLEYEYKDLKDGGFFTSGVYNAKLSWIGDDDFVFEPMEVTKDSPEELVFKIDKEFTYNGLVVNGITGEPIEGAFVLGLKYSNFLKSAQKNIANITDEEWDRLHRINKDFDDELLGEIFQFEKMTRTDASGLFEINAGLGREFYSFLVFEKDYLSIKFVMPDLKIGSKRRMQVPTIPLFPAAKVVVEPLAENEDIRIASLWVIDANDYPVWTGKPDELNREEIFIEAESNSHFEPETEYMGSGAGTIRILSYMLLDFIMTDRVWFFCIPVAEYKRYNPISMLSGPVVTGNDPNNGAVWMSETSDEPAWLDESFMIPEDDPNRAPTFYEIQKMPYSRLKGTYFFICDKDSLKPNRFHAFNVPAELDMKLRVYVTNNHRYEYKWAAFTFPQIFNLKQGETLDLGACEIKVAPRVFVKVVDSKGESIEGVTIKQRPRGFYHPLVTKSTDENGVASFYSRYNRKFKFVVSGKENDRNLKKELPYEIKSEEEAGMEFTFEVPDEILNNLLK